MTRLTKKIIDKIPQNLESYEKKLEEKTGSDLLEIAMKSSKVSEKKLREKIESSIVGVVPITSDRKSVV